VGGWPHNFNKTISYNFINATFAEMEIFKDYACANNNYAEL